jgi:hypothetical protein
LDATIKRSKYPGSVCPTTGGNKAAEDLPGPKSAGTGVAFAENSLRLP